MATIGINDLKNPTAPVEGQTGYVISNPNLIPRDQRPMATMREVTPEQLGFEKEEIEEKPDDVTKALSMCDEMIEKRKEEVRLFNDLIDQTDGDLTEAELREALGQDNINHVLGDISQEDIDATNNRRLEEGEQFMRENAISTNHYDDEENYDIEDDNFVYRTPEPTATVKEYPHDERRVSNVVKMVDNTEIKNINGSVSIFETDKGPDPIITPASDNYVSITETVKKPQVNKPMQVEELPKKVDELPTDIHTLAFPDDEFGEEDFSDEEESDQEKEEKEQIELLKREVQSKIKPVAKIYDLKAFTVTKKPVAVSSTVASINGVQTHIADWVLYSTGRPITMRGFTGNEIEKLNNPGGTNRYNTEKLRYQMIYDHIIDKNKPNTMEEWAKCTSYLDIDHIWMAIFRACFDGSNYIPYNCPNKQCKNKAFLSDNIDIMELVKFKDDKAKQKFYETYNKQSDYSHKYYTAEMVQVSDYFAITIKEPSIYDMIFELAMLDTDFVEKFREVLTIITYIDEIYHIDPVNMVLSPVGYKKFTNNPTKTLKAKISQYSKILRTLSSDQYNAILQYINKISDDGEGVTYRIPETTCSVCGTKIPEQTSSASNLVFIRHQLTTITAV